MRFLAGFWRCKCFVAGLAVVVLTMLGNITYASEKVLPLSDDDAEMVGLGVKIRMSNDEKNCGIVQGVVRLEKLDRQTDQGKQYAYGMMHTNGTYEACAVFYEGDDHKLSMIMILPQDESKPAYAKAAAPIIIYSLLTLGVEQKDIERLVLRNLSEGFGMVNYKFNGKSIILYTQKPEGTGRTSKYFIASL